jgi:hypothetical protein
MGCEGAASAAVPELMKVAAGYAALIHEDVDLEDGYSCATLSLLAALSRVGASALHRLWLLWGCCGAWTNAARFRSGARLPRRRGRIGDG